MASDQTVQSRSIVRSRDVHRAASVSLAIHLLLLSAWLLGNAVDVWRHLPKQRAKRIDDLIFQLPYQLVNLGAKKKEEKPQEPDPILTFVEVDPAKIVKEAPAEAKFYGAASTLAANPKVGNDPSTPKLEGTQTDYVKTIENTKNNSNPIPPTPDQSGSVNNSDTVKSKKAEPEIVETKLAKQKPAPAEAPKPEKIAEPPTPVPATKPESAVEVAAANPKPAESAPAEVKSATTEAPKREKLSQGDVELPKRDSDRLVQLASGNSNPQIRLFPELPTAEELNESRPPDPIVELASTRPLLPKEPSQRQGTALDAADPLPNTKYFEADAGTAELADDLNKDLVAAKHSESEKGFDPKEPSGTAAPPRPRRLEDVQRGAQGEQTAFGGGVQRYDMTTSLMVKGTVIGDYDQRFIIAVRQRWDTLLERATVIKPGKVVLDFRIHLDGRVSQLTVRESNVTETQAAYCEAAILDPAPYSRWPTAMRNELKSDWRDVTFTFYYLAN